MVRKPATVWFDFVDPLSILLILEADRARREGASWAEDGALDWRPFELRPPPTPLVAIEDPAVAARWAAAREQQPCTAPALDPPRLVPWTRKAHELVAFAAERDAKTADPVRTSIARAYAVEGRDIGRVDVLVDIAIGEGFDRTETRAVLDVDRYEGLVSAQRAEALDLGIEEPPTIVRDGALVRGFHNRTTLGTLLGT